MAFLILAYVGEGRSQVELKDLAGRDFDAVVVSTSSLEGFHGLPIIQFYLYAYDADSSIWRVVPFQIDERDAAGSYFGEDDGLLDANDELVVLSRDLGDRVPDGFWIENGESKLSPRYEIEISDTLRGGQKAWAYLFHSTTIDDFVFDDYLTYDRQNDYVTSKYYEVGFHPRFGLPVYYAVTTAGGGNSENILDRMKLRINVKGNVSGFTSTIRINENHIENKGISPFANSQVRFIRNMTARMLVKVSLGVFGSITVLDIEVEFPFQFYPYSMIAASDSIKLKRDDVKIKILRNSLDYNPPAVGMYFYNSYNPEQLTANLIDGNGSNTGIDRTVNVPALNWQMVTGEPGTILTIYWVSEFGDFQQLYFWDNKNGGVMDDANGPEGDKWSYGDSGVLITGDNITGSFRLQNTTYFLPPVEDVVLAKGGAGIFGEPMEVGEALQANLESPVDIHVREQLYDVVPPRSVDDLAVVTFADSNMTVSWRAPGDDGSAGRSASYDLRYSLQAPEEENLDGWFKDAIPVLDIPAPQQPGEPESYVLTGLNPSKAYYVAVRTSDEAGNVSQISNVATGVVLHVDLAGFHAVASDREIQIYWQTANEHNNLGFELERRTEMSPYSVIAFIPGHGTSSLPYEYSYIDRDVTGGMYYYRLNQIDANGVSRQYDEIIISVSIPKAFALHQNYPNPFNPITTLEYELASNGPVRLLIYNTVGQLVTTLVDETKPAGRYRVEINAVDWPSGIYFGRLAAGGLSFTRKMLLLE